MKVALVKTMYVHLHRSCLGELGKLVKKVGELLNRPEPDIKAVVAAVRCERVLIVLTPPHLPTNPPNYLKCLARSFWGTEFSETTSAGEMWRGLVRVAENMAPMPEDHDIYAVLERRISILLRASAAPS